MNSNSWAIRIVVVAERNFPNVLVGDEIVAYGIVDVYEGSMITSVINNYVLWVYGAAECIYDFTVDY
jgi:hypothetical protein